MQEGAGLQNLTIKKKTIEGGASSSSSGAGEQKEEQEKEKEKEEQEKDKSEEKEKEKGGWTNLPTQQTSAEAPD